MNSLPGCLVLVGGASPKDALLRVFGLNGGARERNVLKVIPDVQEKILRGAPGPRKT